MKFRKKPVVIEAVQYGMADYADNPAVFSDTPDWLQEAIDKKVITFKFLGEDYWYAAINTLEGEMLASPGDWIIRGIQGEIYPCKPDIFAATYEAAEDE